MTRGKKIAAIAAAAVAAGIAVGAGTWVYAGMHDPIQLKSPEPCVELGDSYDPASNISSVFLADHQDVEIESDVHTDQPGVYPVIYRLHGQEVQSNVIVCDRTGPDLKVQDVTAYTFEDLDKDDFVVSCTDLSKATTQLSDNQEIPSEKGDHTITLEAVDAYGNKSTAQAVLHRLQDTAAPVISGELEPVHLVQGDWFEPEQLSAKDDVDGDVEVQADLQDFDPSTPGEYTIAYVAKDRSGNESRKEQTVTVEKQEPEAEEPAEKPETSAPADQPIEGKVVYLTFDDGPSENTAKILDILDRYNAKATFFITGYNQNLDGLVAEAASRGHSIGLHTYSHDYANVYASDEAYFADLNRIGDLAESILGYRPTLIRFPGGSSNTISANYSPGIMSRLTQKVLDQGYQYFDWNVSSNDAAGNTVDTKTIIDSSCNADMEQIVLLFHDSGPKTTTVEALPAIIEHYQERGYQFAGLNMASYASHHGVNN